MRKEYFVRKVFMVLIISLFGTTHSLYGDGKIQKRVIGTGATTDYIVGGQPNAIVRDGASLLWIANSNGNIQKMVIGDGSKTDYYVGGQPNAIILDGATLLWVANGDGKINKMIKGTGAITNYSIGGQPNDLVLDGSYLWVANGNGKIQQIAVSNGTVNQEFNVGGQPNAVILDGANFLWVANGNGVINKIVKGTGAVTNYTVSGQPNDLVLDGGYLWVANRNGKIQQIAVDVGTINQEFNVGGQPNAVILDGANLLWIANGNGDINKIIKGTGEITNYTVGGQANDIILDGATILWIANSNGTTTTPLSITTSSLSNGIVGSSYNTTLQATGGLTPYTWSVLSGSFPNGLSLSSSGQISGTPTSAGTFNFTVKVEDSQTPKVSTTKSLSITINPPPPLIISTSSLSNGIVGTIYNATLQATGGLPPYLWSIASGSLPAGLTLSPAGLISGTPVSAGSFTFTIKVEDSQTPKAAAIKSLSLTISPPPPLLISTTNLPDGMVGTNYSTTLLATGGLKPYTWSLVSGSLPAGLTLSPTGQISGTPGSGGSFSFTVKVEDSQNPKASDTKSLSITVEVPAPIVNILTPNIEYGEVELGYRYKKAINIKNDGNAVLNFWLSVLNSPDPDQNQFEYNINEPQGFTVEIGETKFIDVTFSPTEEKESDIDLLIFDANIDGWNQKPEDERKIHIHGKGVPAIPLSTMMVMDRSGSMSGHVGEDSKIQTASNAGITFSSLLNDNVDWFGITKYNQESETIVSLGSISLNRNEVQENLVDIDGTLNPDGSTCIGCGMVKASEQFTVNPDAPSDHQAMIVLTDGKENVHPYIMEVKNDIKNANPNLQIFCVGIGDPIETGEFGIEGIESSKLQQIADEFDGLFKIIQTLTGEHIYDLEAFYFKVFAKAKGHQIILDPTYLVSPSDQLYEIAKVNIAECDRMADFLIINERKEYNELIRLQDPTGQLIDPSSTIGGIGVQIKDWGNARLIRIIFPPRAQNVTYCGTWKLLLQPVQKTNKQVYEKAIYQIPDKFRVAFMAAVGSDYRMQASVTKGRISINQPIHLGAELTEAWWPAPNGTVSVDITKPDGSIIHRDLFDDGYHNDGNSLDSKFGFDFTDTGQKGYYEFLFRSTGQTERGETIVREEQLAKYVVGYESPLKHGQYAGFHVGSAHPLGELNKISDANVHVRLDMNYQIINDLQIMAFVGFNQFTSEWNSGIEHPCWINISLNLKKLQNVPIGFGMQVYWQGGPGYYIPKSGSNKLGFNLGTGVQLPIYEYLGLEFGIDYNYIYTKDRTMFLSYQLGVLFRLNPMKIDPFKTDFKNKLSTNY